MVIDQTPETVFPKVINNYCKFFGSFNWFNAAMQEVPLLSPCPPPPPPAPAPAPAPPMLSKNVGGKFKYLNRKNSEF